MRLQHSLLLLCSCLIREQSSSQEIHTAPDYLDPTLPMAHPSFPSAQLFQMCVGNCHRTVSLCHVGEKPGAQVTLTISLISPICPEQLWQCLSHVQMWYRFLQYTNICIVVLCPCLRQGRIFPALIYFPYLIQNRQNSQRFQMLSEDVRAGFSLPRHVAPCQIVSRWASSRSREGRAVPSWTLASFFVLWCSCYTVLGQVSLPRGTLYIQTYPRAGSPSLAWTFAFYFLDFCVCKHSLVIFGAHWDLIQKDGFLPCP